jgi:hypothetical protein
MLTSVVSHKFYIQSGQEELSQRSRRGDREGMAVEDLLRNVTDKLGHGAWGMGHGKCQKLQALEKIISLAYYSTDCPNCGRAENIGTF